jgi:hypothetical protein
MTLPFPARQLLEQPTPWQPSPSSPESKLAVPTNSPAVGFSTTADDGRGGKHRLLWQDRES